MAPNPPIVYLPSLPDEQLRQGEIVTNLKRYLFKADSFGTNELSLFTNHHDFAIVVSQDCDLAQDFTARTGTGKDSNRLPNILFCEVVKAEVMRGIEDKSVMNSNVWSTIKLNKADRYHFLEKIPANSDSNGVGLPELAIDFKRYFCVQTDEIYSKLKARDFERRCRLSSPYLEHLSSRFSNFQSRVALPHDHESEPAQKA